MELVVRASRQLNNGNKNKVNDMERIMIKDI